MPFQVNLGTELVSVAPSALKFYGNFRCLLKRVGKCLFSELAKIDF